MVRLEKGEGFESIRAYILLRLELHTCFDHFSTECKLEMPAVWRYTSHGMFHVSLWLKAAVVVQEKYLSDSEVIL